jgi:hypothetical protein
MKKDKMTCNDLQSTTQKIKDRATRTPLSIGGELWCSGSANIVVFIYPYFEFNEVQLGFTIGFGEMTGDDVLF